jgi:tetratricopeptide (TPR) repeat protein
VIQIADNGAAYNNLGNAYFEQGKLNQALSNYNAAIHLGSGPPYGQPLGYLANTYENRAKTYLRLTRKAQANADFEKATRLRNLEAVYFDVIDNICQYLDAPADQIRAWGDYLKINATPLQLNDTYWQEQITLMTKGSDLDRAGVADKVLRLRRLEKEFNP